MLPRKLKSVAIFVLAMVAIACNAGIPVRGEQKCCVGGGGGGPSLPPPPCFSPPPPPQLFACLKQECLNTHLKQLGTLTAK